MPTASADAFFEVFSWSFYGEVRAFSLFGSASKFGHYIALVGALGISFLYSEKLEAKAAGLVLTILVLAAGFATLTRATYMEILMTLFAAWLLVRPRGTLLKYLVSLLPLVYGVTGAFVAFALPSWITVASNRSPLLSDNTLLMRYASWDTYGGLWMESDLFAKLFGMGIIQNNRFPVTENVLIDNSFLALLIHIGLLGLMVWLMLMWALWRYVLRVAISHGSPLAVAIAAIWSTWMATGVFGITTEGYPLLLVLLLLSSVGGKAEAFRKRNPWEENLQSRRSESNHSSCWQKA
ncbi:hypothetical protein Rxyl_0565 [Rubrobacter xylanophilus DSM 9941]|uniref:O-antigen polymerase n=1 Tax=Rubrobacter xylanophilus (strain DSM 9941 / JCM 11954 / NBRC 16129 / PRD-1) TaxID=266117 RepID=Q1AYI9_RUBXD|nr:hypothetical protein Rxyl_0565 [Rubrobacter xylanophilus DSM 9941]